jgi:hypothetical protein
MMKKISTYLFAIMVCSVIRECAAEPGFSIRKVPNSTNIEFVHASNSSGWIVFGIYKEERSSIILGGPKGYQRDLSEVITNGMGNNAGYPFKVTADGSVIFVRQELLSSGSYIDTELLRLPFGGSKFESLLNLPPQNGHARAFDINKNGDYIAVDYNVDDPEAGVTLFKKHGNRRSSHTMVLPNGTPSRKGLHQSITLLLADSGEIFLSRRTVTPRTLSLLDVCAGALSEAALTCSSKKRIRPLAQKGFYDFKFLQSGGVIGISGSTSELIKLSDFSTQFRFKANFRNVYWNPVISDDHGSFALIVPDIFKFKRFTLISQQPGAEKKRISCSSPLEFRENNAVMLELTAGSKDSFYMRVSLPEETVLYEVTRAEIDAHAGSLPGICSYAE